MRDKENKKTFFYTIMGKFLIPVGVNVNIKVVIFLNLCIFLNGCSVFCCPNLPHISMTFCLKFFGKVPPWFVLKYQQFICRAKKTPLILVVLGYKQNIFVYFLKFCFISVNFLLISIEILH